MDNLKLICAEIALIAIYIIVLFVGLPFIVAVLGFINGFIIFLFALVVVLIMFAVCLLPCYILHLEIKKIGRG